MDASALWLNEYLDRSADADELATLLTAAGFPVDGREDVDLGGGVVDVRQDFETTSNRGDCLSHIGLAREVAAVSGRALKIPPVVNRSTGANAADVVSVTNNQHQRCPLYTARVITGVTIRPSPKWLQDRLRAIGQIPRNNIVDATNFVLFEYGQPTHVFDLAKIRGGKIVIRMARKDEPFLPIGEGESEIKLTDDDLVIADAEEAVAIGGVKGGAVSAVTENTKEILIEAATFDPVSVRNSSRRHQIASASAYRYERGVHAAHVNPAAERLVQLILELAGGTLHAGVVADGAPIPELTEVSMRPARCRQLMGVEIGDDWMLDSLTRLGFSPRIEGDRIHCIVPCHRLDIEREVDLIEEICRMFGHDKIPIAESIAVRVPRLQPRVEARRAVATALVGMDFVECVTHSLTGVKTAQAFVPDEQVLLIDEERKRDSPALRPSLMSSLLSVRALNRARGVNGLRLFEYASTFVKRGAGHHEEPSLALLADVEDRPLGLRPLRGAIERVATLLAGHGTTVQVTPAPDTHWLRRGTAGRVVINGQDVGWIGEIKPQIAESFEVDIDVMAAELALDSLFERFPPISQVQGMPEFPAIERDLSPILDESQSWDELRRLVVSLELDLLESVEFVTTYRGKQIGSGKKSLTLRLRFRAADRTLTHQEVDPQVNRAVDALRASAHAEFRA